MAITVLELHDPIDESDTLEAFTDNNLGYTYVRVEEEERSAQVRLTPEQVKTLITFLAEEAL